MAAPHIPNLNTLRTTARGNNSLGRGRGSRLARGRDPRGNDHNSDLAATATTTIGSSTTGTTTAEGSSTSSSEQEERRKDEIVRGTDEDASVSRVSAVEAGYLEDPFAKLFLSSQRGGGGGGGGAGTRRFPIINRGTYIRTRAIDRLVTLFLSSLPSVKKQIISLGAGSDTRFFRLAAAHSPVSSFVYHELDFPAVTGPKISTIAASQLLKDLVPAPLSLSPTSLHSPTYHIHPIDLRTLDPSSPSHHYSSPATQLPHVESSLPTLIISECCLVYLAPHAADAVATYLTRTLFPPSTPLGMILYEPIRPHDAFGQVMVANLAARGIALQTLRQYGSLAAQRERMQKYGFGAGGRGAHATTTQGGEEVAAAAAAEAATGGIGVADVNHLWEKGVPPEEKARVAGLEMVDELEEWELLAAHYCVVWAWRDGEAAAGDERKKVGEGGEDGGGDGDTAGAKGTGTGKWKGLWEGWRAVVGQEIRSV